ncbi:MAG: zinc transporter [Gammaproteobacteria bacterium CG11_big_fil_rev_8_21_14_0_20_46_22]|nr:MAG: zinc transporter [Gammaproteobacteria bacterium CG12_big_fil_rev_8_21_14_0_65_46_12]PIR11247.1 MAG: zinc transporter [Gammaproteobacteria bacterium CG11_big_fil_rev_8_21_14_0_20_46_22]
MTHLSTLKLITSAVIFIIAIAAAWIPFRQRTKTSHMDFPIGEALASGVFLGAGLIHMLGDASQDFFSAGLDYPFPYVIAGAVFLGLLWLEHLGREVYEHQGAESPSFAILALIMLSLHSFFAGAALGLAHSAPVMTVIFIAIIAHKWAAGFALAIQLNKSCLTQSQRVRGFMIFALMTPLGIFFGDLVSHYTTQLPLAMPIFSSIAAGTFIYLGTLHGLSRAVMVEKCCNLKHYSFVILGFVLMAIVAIWT